MLRLIVVALCIGMLCAPSWGQVKTGFKNLEGEKWDKAKVAFEKDLVSTDTTTLVAALFGMAKVMSQDGFTGRNMAEAYQYAKRCSGLFEKRAKGDKEMLQSEYSINAGGVKSMLGSIATKAWNDLEKNKQAQVSDYDAFLGLYDAAPSFKKTKATGLRNTLAYKNTASANTYEAFGDLLRLYGASLKSATPDLFVAAQKRYCELYMARYTWSRFSDFAAQNPENPYVIDSLKTLFLPISASEKSADFEQFATKHTGTLYGKVALDSTFAKLLKSKNLTDMERALATFPTHPTAKSLWMRHYELYIGERGNTIDNVMNYRLAYPKFPSMNKLDNDLAELKKQAIEERNRVLDKEKDLKKQALLSATDASEFTQFFEWYPEESPLAFEEAWAKAIMTKPTVRSCEQYLKIFKTSTQRNAVLQQLYNLQAQDGELITLIRFSKTYPDFADTARLNKDLMIARMGNALQLHSDYTPTQNTQYDTYIKAAAPKELAFVALQRMIAYPLKQKKWAEAVTTIQKYSPYFGSNHPKIKELLATVQAPEQNITSKNLGNAINTERGKEFVPVLSSDSRTLYFCAKDRPDNLGLEDIFISTSDGKNWSIAKLERTLSSIENNDAPLCISADGTQFLTFKNGNILTSTINALGWSAPESISPTINSGSWQSDATLSSNGQILIFAARRPENIGDAYSGDDLIHGDHLTNIDLYLSQKDANDNWSKPTNLSSLLNTPYTDRMPFLHPDTKTLYFSSDGHGGLGKLDVFKTTRLDDTWLNWSEPVNLGKEINTPETDWGYKVATDGQTAYFAVRKPNDDQDIFQINLPTQAQPEKVMLIKGKLTDDNGKPISTTLTWTDLASNKPVGTSTSNPNTGEYTVILPIGKLYGYTINSATLITTSQSVDLRNGITNSELTQNLTVYSIADMRQKQIPLTLKNLFFATGSSQIQPESYTELDRMVGLIKTNNLQVDITGHTDNVGSDENNRVLSNQRANAVREYLAQHGCNPNNITATGIGETQPVADNNTDEGRALNRRVELRFR